MKPQFPVQNNINVKALEFYTDILPLINNERKFRRLFEATQSNSIFASLYFYNKLSRTENWTLSLKFRVCKDNEIIFEETNSRQISADDYVDCIECRIADTKKGSKHKAGIYEVECLLDDNVVAQSSFCIVDMGCVSDFGSPYILSRGARLYESKIAEEGQIDKEYKNIFKISASNKICMDFKALNLLNKVSDWLFEVLIRIRTQTGELVVLNNVIHRFGKEDTSIELELGWGNDGQQKWTIGSYKVEIYFLEKLLHEVPFLVIEMNSDLNENYFSNATQLDSNGSLADNSLFEGESVILNELSSLVGHDSIKESILKKYNYLKFLKLRKDNGINDVNEKLNIHAVFTGNAGTGKSRVAKILAKLYKNAGLLSKGGLTEVSRNDLLGEFKGNTAPKVLSIFKEQKGNVLLINNANALFSTNTSDYGMEALETIYKSISDGISDICIIFSGETPQMNYFIANDHNLHSKFSSIFHFSDFTPEELIQIAQKTSEKQQVILDAEAQGLLKSQLIKAYRERKSNFTNSRYVISAITEAKQNLGTRIIVNSESFNKIDILELKTIRSIDLNPVFNNITKRHVNIAVDREMLNESLKELNKLVGMDDIKAEINELVKLAEYYFEIGKDFTNAISLHSIFKGNPGTGKTTLARLLSKIFNVLGILEKGHLVETSREGLIAKYLGQTAEKTAAKIEESMGGVLFIDEAYSLISGTSDSDYGSEAISTLMQYMENRRGSFAVICAGYSSEMEMLLDSNPGFRSRFDNIFEFKDYTLEELIQIGIDILSTHDLVFDENAFVKFKQIVEKACNSKSINFGNARDIRKIIETIVRKQNIRVGEISKDDRTSEIIKTIKQDDLKSIRINLSVKSNKLGF